MKTKQHQITLDLDPDIHETLKAKAANAGKPLESFISDRLDKKACRVPEEVSPRKEPSK